MIHRLDPERLTRVTDLSHRYVDDGRLPCAVIQVKHRGEVVLRDAYGWADVREERPISTASVFRIFSMTKPITSLALMQLHERGEVYLDDPVSRFIPEFRDVEVFESGDADDFTTVALDRPVTVKDLLTHTSGLTYGFNYSHPVDKLYRRRGIGSFERPQQTLAEICAELPSLPLVYQPGTRWIYSMATDVVGRVVEVASGQSLDAYLAEHILEPLGMTDTGFSVDRDHYDRLPSVYMPDGDGLRRIEKREATRAFEQPTYLGGGGGLASTLDDYQAFCDMIIGGGVYEGERIVGRRTLEYMGRNHLPGNALLNDLRGAGFSETAHEGMGFGLGFSVLEDPAANNIMGTRGELAWGGAASTAFWVDPAEELSCVFLTQLMPSSTYPIRRELRTAVYQALV